MRRTLALLCLLSMHVAAWIPDFQVRILRQSSAKAPTVTIVLTNGGLITLDSLALRVFVRAPDTVGSHSYLSAGGPVTVPAYFPRMVGARFDTCLHTAMDGYPSSCDRTWTGRSRSTLDQATRILPVFPAGPVGPDGKREWGLDIPLGPLVLKPAESVRLDVSFWDRDPQPKVFDAAMDSILALASRLPRDRVLPSRGDTIWSALGTDTVRTAGILDSWSFAGIAKVEAESLRYSVGRIPSNSRVVLFQHDPLWGTSPDGSAPGVGTAPPSPDSGRVLPYAKIAAASVVDGDRSRMDSALARPSRVRVNQAGYRRIDLAQGLGRIRYFGPAGSFLLRSDRGALVSGGAMRTLGFQAQSRVRVCQQVPAAMQAGTTCRWIDSDTLGTSIARTAVQEGTLPSDLAEGRWRAIVGPDTSAWFQVSDSVYGWVRDAAVRSLGIQRSGDSSWFHGASHMFDGLLDGVPGAYVGGWYDAGDHLKEPQTMAYALAALATISAALPDRDADRWGSVHRADVRLDGIPDILKEARWGASFFLKSWTLNGRQVAADSLGRRGMVTGIGDFGKDHSYWGLPEFQDAFLGIGIGGRGERTVRRELGANTLGDVAAALAILSVRWRPHDPAWADTSLAAARSLYSWIRQNPSKVTASPAYNGAFRTEGSLALAAVALLWASRDSSYLLDLAYDRSLGSHGDPAYFPSSHFAGGWLALSSGNLTKNMANTDWASRHAYALYALAKLVLLDPQVAGSCGVRTETERRLLLRRTAFGMQANLEDVSGGSSKVFDFPMLSAVDLPQSLSVDPRWGMLTINMRWGAPRYVAGNITELLMYADVVSALRAGQGGEELAAFSWPVEAARELAVRQFDWILGLNAWDASLVAGIGSKNLQNIHHRAANPDGSNSWMRYPYRTPVGAMWGFTPSDSAKVVVQWEDYMNSEATLDGAVQLLTAAAFLSPANASTPVGVSSRRGPAVRLSARSQGRRIEAVVEGARIGETIEMELLDVLGRTLVRSEGTADRTGRYSARLPPVARGLAILRVRTSEGVLTRSLPVP